MRANRTRIAKSLVTLALGVGVYGAGLGAQETKSTGALTLPQAVNMALEQNPAFRESSDEQEAARARLKQAQAAWYQDKEKQSRGSRQKQ